MLTGTGRSSLGTARARTTPHAAGAVRYIDSLIKVCSVKRVKDLLYCKEQSTETGESSLIDPIHMSTASSSPPS